VKDYKELLGKIGKDKLLLMAAAGIVLIVCSVPTEKKSSDSEQKGIQQETLQISTEEKSNISLYVENLEERLADIIGEIEGVKNVHVMITVKGSEGKEILKDENISSDNTKESDGAGGERSISSYNKDENTIYYKDSSGAQYPYVLSEIMPEIEGVAVVADGGNSPVIKEKIINLIKALFGLEINKIMVTV
jgi:hypothetical protein